MNEPISHQPSCIILLMGIAGTGKKTIGDAIIRQDKAFKLAHHHDWVDPVLKLFDDDCHNDDTASVWYSLDEKGWNALNAARKVIFDTIANVCAPESSFVITYEMLANNIYHQALFNEVVELTHIRQARFIPVRLICDLDELLKRVTGDSRKKYYKTHDTTLIRERFTNDQVFSSHLASEYTLNVTNLTPEEAASHILQWCQKTF
ncbi:MAG: hypothetical protein Q8R83_02195 [Legionellaceae bacterium]|nr:hypothetical protein [Legionellaceae bacterium]